MKLGVVGNPTYRDLGGLLARLSAAAPKLGIALSSEPGLAKLWPEPPAALDPTSQLDCLLTLGGDGTLLRGARLLGGRATPVLGVNLGRVGFLTTASSDNLDWALDALVRGAFATEDRMTLQSHIEEKQGRRTAEPQVLNDVVLHKGGVARVVRMRVAVDGDEVGYYSADGIVVATPTGSTAYSLSAGGPIVVPGVDAIVVTAIAPHTLAVRTLVLRSSAVVTIEPLAHPEAEMLVSFDGQTSTPIAAGSRLVVRKGDHPVRLVRLGPEGFFARMRKKLQWGDLSDRDRR